MRYVCLVTNYNYADFLGECLASLTSQTRPFDRIIIVDDGSSDRSREVIEEFCRGCGCAQAIHKENGGQLSAFSAALESIEPADYVFFLDADDLYPPDYLEQAVAQLAAQDSDFFFSTPVSFREGEQRLKSAVIGDAPSFAFASTSALTRMMQSWVGQATSCLALRGSLLKALLPYPYQQDWVTRADDVLIFGASILGAHKLYAPSLGVNYRVHGSNNFAGKTISATEKVDWRLRHERLFTWFAQKAGVLKTPPLKNALHESAVIPKEIRKQLNLPSPMLTFFYRALLLVPFLWWGGAG
jgi:glycosyltransferase involved in cell wall biosynthesis